MRHLKKSLAFLTVLLAGLALYALLNPDRGERGQRSAGATVDAIDNGRDTLRTEQNGTGRAEWPR